MLTNGIIESAGMAVGIMKGNLGLTAFGALEITIEAVESKMKGHFMNDKPVYSEVNFRDNAQYIHTGDNVGGDMIVNNYYGAGNTTVQARKRFTNKRLISPFTREKSNGAQGGTYVQRDDLLEKIAACFKSQAGMKRMVFLTGMGGCGKSELARAYADNHSDEYEEIFWLTCTDGVSPKLMGLMADADTLCEVTKEDVYKFSSDVLIIVDNCNKDDGKFMFAIEHSTGDADILVTTRLSRMGEYKNLIPVESDDRERFAYQVFEKNYCRKPRWGNPKKIEKKDAAAVREICREVQYNTMIVSMIGIRLREYEDLSIFWCATKIRKGVGTLDGRVRYSKDLKPRKEEIRDILEFLFSDILEHHFSDEEKAVLTVLSLTPASWYGIDYIVSLCKGDRPGKEHEDAVLDLLDLGWIQGDGDRIAIHPLIAEVISVKKKISKEPSYFEQLIENYLGLPDQYLGRERLLIDEILDMGATVRPESRLAVMLLINHGTYKKIFSELFPEVKAAYFVYVVHDGKRWFLYRDLGRQETRTLIGVPCQVKKKQAELLEIANKGMPYKLDLNVAFHGKVIEKVPDGLCWNDYFLREIILPVKLIDIGKSAFSGCRFLSGELHLPESLMSIGDSAFSGCRGLSGELRLPEGLTSIEDSVFSGCSGLSGELHLPESLMSIGDSAFQGCSSLSGELRLPESLTSIGNSAFRDCTGLGGGLRLPENLTSIDDAAFYCCSGLSGELSLPKGLTSIDDVAFDGCSGSSGELHLPEGLMSIGNSAFRNCRGLSGELHLPEGLKRIGSSAFWGCRGLSGELRLPESLTSIGNSAFRDCTGLGGELRLPKGLTSIDDATFSGCRGLSGELLLPKVLTSIENNAFMNCRGLSGELHLPEGLKSIGSSAFLGCSSLSGELHLPEGLKRIGSSAFLGCRGLSGELHLPESLTSIGNNAFMNCRGLSGELHLPEGLTSIRSSAFLGCSSLSGELLLPEGLTSIGSSAFLGCSGLSGELCLPENLMSIGDGAFYYCNGIEKIFFYNPYTEIKGTLNFYTSTVICGYRNSTAEEYARKQGLVFEELEM